MTLFPKKVTSGGTGFQHIYFGEDTIQPLTEVEEPSELEEYGGPEAPSPARLNVLGAWREGSRPPKETAAWGGRTQGPVFSASATIWCQSWAQK